MGRSVTLANRGGQTAACPLNSWADRGCACIPMAEQLLIACSGEERRQLVRGLRRIVAAELDEVVGVAAIEE